MMHKHYYSAVRGSDELPAGTLPLGNFGWKWRDL
jgi:hypothetical protein